MTRRLSNWLKGYREYTKASEAPAAFHFWTGVSTIAAVLQRKVWIEENAFQWTPNFYIIFVGPAGIATKSTTIRLGSRLLQEIDSVFFGPNSLTWQRLAEALAEAQANHPYEGEGVNQKYLEMSCITCTVSELGTFLDPGDRKLIDVVTDLWDAQEGRWIHGTITRGSTTIQNPWLNIIGATTPSWLKTNFPESMIGGGLTSRIIFVWGDKKVRLIPYPHLIQPSAEFKKIEEDLVHDLKEMNEMIGQYHLTAEAIKWGKEWYIKHWGKKPPHLSSERFEGYMARKQTHLHKLAIVIAASQRNELTITLEDLQTANKGITLIEKDMLRVFDSIGATSQSQHVITMVKLLMVHGGHMDELELWKNMEKQLTRDEFEKATEAAIRSGYISLARTGPKLVAHLISVPEGVTGWGSST